MWVSMGCGTVSFSLLVCYSLSPLFVSESTTSVALSTAATILFTFWQRMTLYGSLICDLMYLIMDTASKQWMYLGVQLLHDYIPVLVLYFWTKLWPGFITFSLFMPHTLLDWDTQGSSNWQVKCLILTTDMPLNYYVCFTMADFTMDIFDKQREGC